MGLILGVAYLAFGRSIIVPIVAHGVQDSIDLWLLYSGNYPMSAAVG
jgi:membrane protease YdiL (CAAX protease family)